MAGAPEGNQNAVKGTRWRQAIDRALAKRSKGDGIKALDELAEKFLDAVVKGEAAHITGYKELADRLDGKAPQTIEGPGPGGEHILVQRPQLTKEEWLKAHGMGTPAGTAD